MMSYSRKSGKVCIGFGNEGDTGDPGSFSCDASHSFFHCKEVGMTEKGVERQTY